MKNLNFMTKILFVNITLLTISYLIDFCSSTKNLNSKFAKEILTPNNLDEIYQTNIQKEFLATSDFRCVFRCGSHINEKLIENKYKEHEVAFDEKSLNMILNIDHRYYCTNVKPLYVVKLTPDVVDQETANELCKKNSKIYKIAEHYCKKEGDCDSPSLEIFS